LNINGKNGKLQQEAVRSDINCWCIINERELLSDSMRHFCRYRKTQILHFCGNHPKMIYNPGKTDFMEIWPGPYKKCMKFGVYPNGIW
jgi:hypothetical protein